jgi:methionyl-tRNA synthetase
MAMRKAKGTPRVQRGRRQGQQLTEWKTVATATAANASELPGTEVLHKALMNVIDEVDTILAEQALYRANKQVTTQRLQTLINRGGKLTTVLKAVAKQHYDHANEKLLEFGIKPLPSRATTALSNQ